MEEIVEIFREQRRLIREMDERLDRIKIIVDQNCENRPIPRINSDKRIESMRKSIQTITSFTQIMEEYLNKCKYCDYQGVHWCQKSKL
jgi:hypothetical protein